MKNKMKRCNIYNQFTIVLPDFTIYELLGVSVQK